MKTFINNEKNIKWNYGFYSMILLSCIILLVVSYVGKEPDMLYYWDYAGYFRQFISYTNEFDIEKLLSSIASSNYNPTPIIIPSLIGKIFSASRLVYILSLTIFYFFPCIILFSYILNYFLDRNDKSVFLIVVTMALAPAFLTPILRGYPDICGLFFILLLIVICINYDFTKLNIVTSVLMGVCFYMPFLLRRWYAYTIIALCVSLPLLNLSLHIQEKRETEKRLKNLLLNFIIAAGVVLILLLLLQKNLVFTILKTDYSYIYSGYQKPILESIKVVANRVGLWIFPFVVLGLVKTFFKINTKVASFVFFSLFNLVISFSIFTKTQSPSMQHVMPFALWLYFIAAHGFACLLKKTYSRIYLYSSIFIILSFSIFSIYITCFVNKDLNTKLNSLKLNQVFPVAAYPLHVDNYPQYIKLHELLKKLVDDNNDKIYILSSNHVLNSDMQFFKSDPLSSKVCRTYNVDLRDELPIELLLSKYLVITTPLQIHLPYNAQRVVSLPRELVLRKKNIGNAYEKTEHEFMLHNNVKAVIYKKKRACTLREVDAFLSSFYKIYPEWKKKYEKKLLLKTVFSCNIELDKGPTSKFAYNVYKDEIYVCPGNGPLKMTWNIGKNNKLILRMVNSNSKDCGPMLVELTMEKSGIHRKYFVEKDKPITVDTSLFKNKISTLRVNSALRGKNSSLIIRAGI